MDETTILCFPEKLNKTEETLQSKIGNRTSKPRLKPQLPKKIFLEA